MSDMLYSFNDAVAANEYAVAETVNLRGRPERLEAVPEGYRTGAVGRWLSSAFPNGIWSHQAEALRRFDAGRNVVIATGTASGKTLVFQSAALQALEHHSEPPRVCRRLQLLRRWSHHGQYEQQVFS